MRLIDADLLTEKITKWLKYDPDADDRMVNIDDIAVSVLMEIEEQPTVFDVQKVIEQIAALPNYLAYKPSINRDAVIKVVKDGGISDS